MSDPVPKQINSTETLTRCVFHYLHYSKSKKKLKSNAFLPPPGRKDVSVLRRDYSPNDTFCKHHCRAIHMANQTYVGIAVILARHIFESNNQNSQGIEITIQSTPQDEEKNIVPPEEDVYVDSPGLPMHADIIYEIPISQKGKTSAGHRITARYLSNIACFYLDKHTQSDQWLGVELNWKLT